MTSSSGLFRRKAAYFHAWKTKTGYCIERALGILEAISYFYSVCMSLASGSSRYPLSEVVS